MAFEKHLDDNPDLDYDSLTPDQIEDPDFDPEDFTIGGRRRIHLAHIKLPEWLKEVRNDRTKLQFLVEKTQSVTPKRDGKLAELKGFIENKVHHPTIDHDGKRKKKVLVFTAFADTARYLHANLDQWAQQDLKIHTGLVCGDGGNAASLGRTEYDDIRRVEVSLAQIEALRVRATALADRRFGVFVALLIDTGARKSELLERRWKDFELERREIVCETTKTGVPRVLHYREETAEQIRRVFPKRAPESLPFEGRVPGQPIEFRKAWLTVVADIGLPDLHMHDVRHAAAAGLLRAGVTLGVAAQVLGHSPQVLARRYGHLETESLRKAQEQAWASAR